MRSRKEIDDITYKLQETLLFYGKELETRFRNIWLTALASFDTDMILGAFDEYIASEDGKYAPKPASIIKILNVKRGADSWNRRYSKDNFAKPGESRPIIAKAWATYMKFAYDWMTPGQKPDMDLEQCLEIVNQEAKKYNNPDAIKVEHRLPEVWA